MSDTQREVNIVIKAKSLAVSDLTAVRQALAGVGVEVESVASKSKKLQTDYDALQDRIRKTAQASEQLTSRFSEQFQGTAVIQRANQYADAVERIGGADRLTAADQATVNKTLQDALGYYRALGEQAPAHLLKLQQQTDGVKTKTQGLLGGVTSVATGFGIAFTGQAVVQGITSFIGNVFDAADNVKDLSERMGVGIVRAQQFGTAARQSGADVEIVTGAIGKMNQNISEGSDKTILSLRGMGLEINTLRQMKPEDAFLAITDEIKKIPSSMDQSRVAMELFGKAGEKLLPGIKEGFRDLADQAEAMPEATVKRLADAKQKWEDFFNYLTIKGAAALNAAATSWAGEGSAQATAWADAKRLSANTGIAPEKLFADAYQRATMPSPAMLSPAAADRVDTPKPHELTDTEKKAAEAAAKLAKEHADKILDIWDKVYEARDRRTLSSYDFQRRESERFVAKEMRDFHGTAQEAAQLKRALDAMVGDQRDQITLNETLAGAFNNQADMMKGQGIFPRFRQGLVAPFTGATIPGTKTYSELAPPPLSLFADLSSMTDEQKAKKRREEREEFDRLNGIGGKPLFNPAQLGSGVAQAITGAAMGGGDAVKAASGSLGQTMAAGILGESGKGGLGDYLGKHLGKTIGGAVAGAVPVIGSLLGPLMGAISDVFTKGPKANDLRDTLKEKFGDAAGAGMQAAVDKMRNAPGLAEAYDRFMHAGNEKDVQRAFDDVQKSMASAQSTLDKYGLSLDDTLSPEQKVAALTKSLGTEMRTLTGLGFSAAQMSKGMAGELNNLVRQSIETKSKIPGTFKPLLDELVKGGGLADDLTAKLLGVPQKAKAPWQDMKAVADEFGISEKNLGQAFRDSQLIDTTQTLADKWHLLVDNGADVGAVIDAMKGKAEDALLNFLKWGIEAPAAMRPLFQAMVDNGLAIDENGNKLEDLSRVKFSEDQFAPLTAALHELIDVLRDDVPDALKAAREAAGRGITIPVEVEQHWRGRGAGDSSDGDGSEPPAFAMGGIAEGRQMARLAERGQREIVGTEQFMANALTGAFQRIGLTQTRASNTQSAVSAETRPLEVVIQLDREVLGRATLRAQTSHLRRDASDRAEYRGVVNSR